MRRLILLLSALSLGIASVAAADDGDIVVTAKRGNHSTDIEVSWGGGGGGGGSGGSGGGGGGGRSTPITITTSTNNIEVTWPATVTVSGETFDVTRVIRCTCQRLTIDRSDLP